MSFDPFTLAAATTVAGTASGAFSSMSGNSAVAGGIASANDSANASLSQLASSAALERRRQVSDAEKILGRIRVARSESGNTLESQERQTMIDAATNVATINTNLSNNRARVISERDAAVARLRSQRSNPLVAGLLGGLEGLSTGLSLGSGLTSLGAFGPALTAAEKSSALLAGEAAAQFLTGVP
jgi:hypothetical protein